jgi:RnfABCDGE-type electron transport complex B subunit
MNIMGVIIAAVVVGAVGIIIGVLLGIASEKFKVEVDEREVLVREELPGNNCGGCGYAGCDALAKAIVEGKAAVNQCPVGGSVVGDKIAAIMGVEAGAAEKKVAFVKCKGTCDKTVLKYNYYGTDDCVKIAQAVPGGGDKACSFGCLGSGSCVKACQFDAIHVVDGVAVVDKEKCVACGKCVATCPRGLITLVPYKAEHLVQCSSHDKGPDVKKKCDVGCIGCTLCTKQCEFDAIHMDNNVAVIDYEKCTNCGKCAAKCPAKVIK